MVCYRRPPSSPHIHSARTAQDGSRKRYSYTSIKTVLQFCKLPFLILMNHTILRVHCNQSLSVSWTKELEELLHERKCFALDWSLTTVCTRFLMFFLFFFSLHHDEYASPTDLDIFSRDSTWWHFDRVFSQQCRVWTFFRNTLGQLFRILWIFKRSHKLWAIIRGGVLIGRALLF